MAVDSELSKTLNVPRTSPTFVLRQASHDESLEVIQPHRIPVDAATYWVSGISVLPSGRNLSSVFVISDGGGTLISVFWYIGGNWFKSDEMDALEALELDHNEVFPFEWSYSVPVENDVYHQ